MSDQFDPVGALLDQLSRKPSVLPPKSPTLDNPVGTENVGGDTQITNPTPGVEPVVTTAFGMPMTQRTFDAAMSHLSNYAMAGTFGGPGAAMSAETRAGLERAQRAAAAGASADEIHAQTGWFVGPDGKWRFNISDQSAMINPAHLKQSDYNEGQYLKLPKSDLDVQFDGRTMLPDVLHHSELYELYPHLRDVEVRGVPPMAMLGGAQGGFNPELNMMYLGPNAEEALPTALHEIQHGIQTREGFARGGNYGEFLPPKLPEAEAAIQGEIHKLEDRMTKGGVNLIRLMQGNPQQTELAKQILGKAGQAKMTALYDHLDRLQGVRDEAVARYQALAGEQESASVQQQLESRDWTSPPWRLPNASAQPAEVLYEGQSPTPLQMPESPRGMKSLLRKYTGAR